MYSSTASVARTEIGDQCIERGVLLGDLRLPGCAFRGVARPLRLQPLNAELLSLSVLVGGRLSTGGQRRDLGLPGTVGLLVLSRGRLDRFRVLLLLAEQPRGRGRLDVVRLGRTDDRWRWRNRRLKLRLVERRMLDGTTERFEVDEVVDLEGRRKQ
jgi:hypothetical protein